MDLSEKTIFMQILQKTISDPKIYALSIYGSYARGEPYHDIDVCLFAKSDSISSNEMLKYRLGFPEKFDIHFFHELPLYIQIHVLNDGIILINKDYNQLFDLYISKFHEYNLFQPHFETYLKGF